VAWGAFVSIDELQGMLEEHAFCPDGRKAFERWLRERDSAGRGEA
jgi:hypothetical protein